MEEIFRKIPNHSGYYASNMGRICSIRGRYGSRFRILTQCNRLRYPYVAIKRDEANGGKRRYWRVNVHILVAPAWFGERPEGMVVNHKDGNKYNNCLDNLEYITREENINHSVNMKLYQDGVNKNKVKCVVDGVLYNSLQDGAMSIDGCSASSVKRNVYIGKEIYKGHILYAVYTDKDYLDLETGEIINGMTDGVFWW